MIQNFNKENLFIEGIKLHHIGYACANIQKALSFFSKNFKIEKISNIIYDPFQRASLCFVEIEDGQSIELVAGEQVEDLIKAGINLYHVCYEVNHLELSLNILKEQGCVQVSEIYPAKLFDEGKVVFVQTEIGLIELLEKKVEEEKYCPIVIGSTFTILSIQEKLARLLEKLTFPYYVKSCVSNDIYFDLIDAQSELNQNNGINIIMIRANDFLDDNNAFNTIPAQELMDSLKKSAMTCLARFIVCICPSIEDNAFSSIRKIENFIENELTSHKNIILMNSNNWVTQEKRTKIHDEITDKEAGLPYKEYFDIGLSLEILKKIYSIAHNNYKVIVVDCDNTLWTGICSEEPTELNKTNILLQEKLVELYEAGFIIVVCSKNNELDVRNIFQKNKNMLLLENHITAWEVNWEKKYENIKKLYVTLNLPLSSFIFIDDSLMECHEMEVFLPEVLTINFVDNYFQMESLFNNLWAFDKGISSTQSINRTVWYKAHLEREKTRNEEQSVEKFIENLHLQIKISPIELTDVARISELSYRVTQFNFSNKQYTENRIIDDLEKNIHVIKVDLSDRYGNYGTVGGIIFESSNNQLYVQAFFLSCRALNRGVEHTMIQFLGDFANSLGLENITFEFTKTDRNIPAKQFIQFLCGDKYRGNSGSYQVSVNDVMNFKFESIKQEPKNILKNSHNEAGVDNFYEAWKIDSVLIKKLSDMTVSWEQAVSFLNENHHDNDTVNHADDNNQFLFILKKIWSETLCCSLINDDSNFFQLGGTSLLALRILSKLYENFNIEIKLYEILKNPKFSDLYSYLVGKINHITCKSTQFFPKAIHLKETDGAEFSIKLAENQKGLWLIDRIFGNSWFYNISSVYSLKGNLNFQALKKSVIQIVNTSDSLRSFVRIENDEPFLTVNQKIEEYGIEIIDVKNSNQQQILTCIKQIQLDPFDLHIYPLYRIKLLKIADNKYILVAVFHHLIFDGWSEGLFNRLLSEFYNSNISGIKTERKESEFEYKDFICWEKELLSSKLYNKSLNYWINELNGIGNVDFPTTYARQKNPIHQGKYSYFSISSLISNKLIDLKKEKNTTLFCLLYTTFVIVLHKISKKDDIVIGVPLSGRFMQEFENVIGNFVSTVALRTIFEKNMTLSEIMEKNHQKIFDAYENQFVPFQDVVKNLPNSRRDSTNPIYNIMFVLQDADNQKLALNDLEVDFYQKGYDAARVDLTLELNFINNIIDGGIYYDTALFDEAFIINIIDHYLDTLSIIIKPESHGQRLNNLFNNNNDDDNLLVRRFEQAAISFPNNIAIKCEEKYFSYDLLNRKSNQWAHYLVSLGIKFADRVILHLLKNEDVIIAILACFKIGAAYIPLDPEYPDDYKSYIINDCESQCVLTNTTINLQLHNKIVNLSDADHFLFEKLSSNNINADIKPSAVAYIMYTSGTTGKPKGVIISHFSIATLINSLEKPYELSEQDKGVLFHSFCFDVSVWEIWSVLSCGGMLHILNKPHQYTSEEFWSFISNQKITLLSQTPTVFENFLSNISLNKIQHIMLRLIILAGEALRPKILIPWMNIFGDEKIKIYNMYGITETTVYSTYQRIDLHLAKTNKSLIGCAIDGTTIELFDDNLNPIEKDRVGEIYIKGFGLAKGYLNSEERNRQSFVSHNNEIWYRSGDLGRRLEDNIEYVGRRDHEIKIRGFRVEPNYIASMIDEHSCVSKSVVWIEKETNRDCLSAVITLNNENTLPINRYIQLINQFPEFLSKSYLLPNGMQILHHRISETMLQYQEIFLDNEYIKHGISLKDNDVIVDIGANIGMFSLLLGRFLQNIQIYAIEPIPELFEILQHNLWINGIDANCFNCAVSYLKEIADFSYYPYASVLSGKDTDDKEVKQLIGNTLKNYGMMNAANEDINEIVQAVSVEKKIKCQFFPLSEFIDKQDLQIINLLKIDVERSELHVLESIRDDQWTRIEQIVIEVHDFSHNYELIVDLLKKKGFNVNGERPKMLHAMDVFMIYAKKDINKNGTDFMSKKPIYHFENEKALILDIKNYLKNKLPAYMIPLNIKVRDKMLVNSHGKIDVDKIKKEFNICQNEIPILIDSINDNFGNTEKKLKTIWENVLKIEINNINENFFDLGGDSFLLLKLHKQICHKISDSIQLIDLFSYTNIKQQAKFFDEKFKAEENYGK